MEKSHGLSAIFGVFGLFGLAVGSLFAVRDEVAFGRTTMIAASIMMAGVLIRSAILEKGNQ